MIIVIIIIMISIIYHLMIFISAILHIKLAQEPVAGRGPERCSPAGGEE